jgi:hypothetical protein
MAGDMSQVVSYILVGVLWACCACVVLIVVLGHFIVRRLDRITAAYKFRTEPPPDRDPETIERWLGDD